MQLRDTLTRTLQELKPLNGKKISLYTCGLTVYAQPHVGNWVGYIYWDVLQRTLEADGYTVDRTQNITDVGHLVSDDDTGEDKMQQRATSEGITAWDIADKYITIANHEAFDLLKLKRPKNMIRATDLIAEQIQFVKELETKGFVYAIKNEGIYFDTSKINDYGKLAKLDIKGLKAGARVPIKGKRNITDFALWKFSPKDKQRDMEWASPWGKGFPGWHLECSVIAKKTLGDQIDIHTGGIDHIPVHHTNELAQTEALTNKPFAAIWLHNNHLKVDGGKMAKSLGNVYALSDITDKSFSVMAFKIFILAKHYSTEGNFTWENIEAAQNRLNDIQAWADLRWQDTTNNELETAYSKTKKAIILALNDDLSTPKVFKLISQAINLAETTGSDSKAIKELAHFIDDLLGLDLCDSNDINATQKELVKQREKARTDKDWAKADKLRTALNEQGISILDFDGKSIWRRNL